MPSLIASQWDANSSVLSLMLDYDGTLAPIVSDPSQAFVQAEHIDLIQKLSGKKNINLAVVSGRSVQQLQVFLSFLNNSDVLFCGLHGGHIYCPRTDTFWDKSDSIKERKILETFKKKLLHRLEEERLLTEGLIFEDKSLALALHTRNISDDQSALVRQIFFEQFQYNLETMTYFKIQPGKAVLELVPKKFNKGRCVEVLYQYWAKRQSEQYLCYVGDDLTDEAAFEVVNLHKGLSIRIGNAFNGTEAYHTLTSIECLYEEISSLVLDR